MADITKFFGGQPFEPLKQESTDPPEKQLIAAMVAAGMRPPETVILDGKMHRFADGSKNSKRDDAGWYAAFADGIPAGAFGSWRSGVSHPWRADIGRTLTTAEEMALQKQLAEVRKIRDAERARQHSVAADTVAAIWKAADDATSEHPYLKRKGIDPYGAKVTGGDGRLMFPLHDESGTLVSIQYVECTDGGSRKKYHPGGKASGALYIIGELKGAVQIYLAEGFATAATVHKITGSPCVAAYSAGNLVEVAGKLRDKLSHLPLTIVADNDVSGAGLQYAEQAAAKYDARFVMPPHPDNFDSLERDTTDANDFVNEDGGNLLELLEPKASGWLVSFREFCSQPSSVRWLIKGWLQRGGLTMIHGMSGCGKSFTVLDWCCRIATEIDEWAGCKVRHGSVVYLAGEGHDGIRSRGQAWFRRHNCAPADDAMFISQHGIDLDTPEGYCKARDDIRCLAEPPALVVVDTVHRHLAGDENSAQDVKKMIDACGGLQREFGCTVLLVHHTGVSEEAQNRARGSSAWKGALEGEFNMFPLRDDECVRMRAIKVKDGREPPDVHIKLEEVVIDDWKDEDGDSVTSVVVNVVDAPSGEIVGKEVHEARNKFCQSWWALVKHMKDRQQDLTQAYDSNGFPYLTRAWLKHWLTGEEMNDVAAAKAVKADGKGFIALLIKAGTIAPVADGFSMVDADFASRMRLTAPKGETTV